jgi:hypothetical protein
MILLLCLPDKLATGICKSARPPRRLVQSVRLLSNHTRGQCVEIDRAPRNGIDRLASISLDG